MPAVLTGGHVARRGRGSRLDLAAESIGGTLGKIAAKVEVLNKERAALAAELRQVIDTAQAMLANLGDYAVVTRRRTKRAVRRVAKRRRRRLSAQGRANIIAAAKKRWARVRKGRTAKS
jgi:hypothetical protein